MIYNKDLSQQIAAYVDEKKSQGDKYADIKMSKEIAKLVTAGIVPKHVLVDFIKNSNHFSDGALDTLKEDIVTDKAAKIQAEMVAKNNAIAKAKKLAAKNAIIIPNQKGKIDPTPTEWKPMQFPEYTLHPDSKVSPGIEPTYNTQYERKKPSDADIMTVKRFNEEEKERRLLEIADEIAALEDEKRYLQNLIIAECDAGEDSFNHLEI